MNNTEWKDWFAREVLLATAIIILAVAAQPLAIRVHVPLGTWGLALVIYWLRLCFGAARYARTRPPLYRDVARILGVIGTLLVILGAFCLSGQLLPGPVFGTVLLVSGVVLIAWSNRTFWKPAHHQPAESPPEAKQG
ncbi:MAG: hypothetical protein L0Z50_35415 [Verrucomicrobiales bacterium]|nr:hypothetical protein [Verrucomicrobiales bacterium]